MMKSSNLYGHISSFQQSNTQLHCLYENAITAVVDDEVDHQIGRSFLV